MPAVVEVQAEAWERLLMEMRRVVQEVLALSLGEEAQVEAVIMAVVRQPMAALEPMARSSYIIESPAKSWVDLAQFLE
ncbi:MAG: hypothetical protein JST16_16035 [Bdellovibrionales bacterium]|nr:hypothetical protein [Bdellovibrionales bacterium]